MNYELLIILQETHDLISYVTFNVPKSRTMQVICVNVEITINSNKDKKGN